MFEQRKPYACHTMHLLPFLEDRHLNFKERMSSMRFKKVPSTHFEIVMKIPRVAALRQAILLFLDVQYDPERSTSPSPPKFLLRELKVTVESRGTIRCRNVGFCSWKGCDITEDWDDEFPIADVVYKHNAPPQSEHMNLREILDLRVKQIANWCPTFRTLNFDLWYQLRVELEVERATEMF